MKNNNYNYNDLNILPIITSYYNPYENKKKIYKENKGKSGIYCWYNLCNDKFYIGSSINLTKRFYCYLSITWLKKESLKYNSLIYRALLDYDYFNYNLIILEYCNLNLLKNKEQFYIDLLKPEYNILQIVRSTKGHKHSLATILKL